VGGHRPMSSTSSDATWAQPTARWSAGRSSRTVDDARRRVRRRTPGGRSSSTLLVRGPTDDAAGSSTGDIRTERAVVALLRRLPAIPAELITRHAIADVLGAGDAAGDPSIRRLPVDRPYPGAKAALVSAIAVANRCASVHSPAFGWLTLVGYDGDLDAVEVLAASLLAPAAGARGARRPHRRRGHRHLRGPRAAGDVDQQRVRVGGRSRGRRSGGSRSPACSGRPRLVRPASAR
jgi:hypothetical protein